MTRSRKTLPITGITSAESDKSFKLAERRRERRAIRRQIGDSEPDDLPSASELPHPKQFGDPRKAAEGWQASRCRSEGVRK